MLELYCDDGGGGGASRKHGSTRSAARKSLEAAACELPRLSCNLHVLRGHILHGALFMFNRVSVTAWYVAITPVFPRSDLILVRLEALQTNKLAFRSHFQESSSSTMQPSPSLAL
jgi:hypothetical protein